MAKIHVERAHVLSTSEVRQRLDELTRDICDKYGLVVQWTALVVALADEGELRAKAIVDRVQRIADDEKRAVNASKTELVFSSLTLAPGERGVTQVVVDRSVRLDSQSLRVAEEGSGFLEIEDITINDRKIGVANWTPFSAVALTKYALGGGFSIGTAHKGDSIELHFRNKSDVVRSVRCWVDLKKAEMR